LDLTEIIAFDAVREWEAVRRLRCRFREWAGTGSCVHTEKSQVRLKKTEKGLWVMKHIAIGILGAATLGLVASAASAATLDDV
ncbi:MAG: amino acid ABC transporter substrate-binding protein, partial [Mesorhizobium sp.]